MIVTEMAKLGFGNLFRTKIRTTLTILGVVIGIGALSSMVSFGTGMQKNVTDAFKKNELFTSLYITPFKININEPNQTPLPDLRDSLSSTIELNDSILHVISGMAEVELAFPEMMFPVKVRYNDAQINTSVQALPASLGQHAPFENLLAGNFFTDDHQMHTVVDWNTFYNLGFIVQDPDNPITFGAEDSVDSKQIVSVESIIGDSISVISATFDLKEIALNPFDYLFNQQKFPIKRTNTRLKITGINKRSSTFNNSLFNAGLVVPIQIGQEIPRLGFSNVWELLGRDNDGQYSSLFVRVHQVGQVQKVKQRIENMGFSVFSFLDQLKQFRRGFLIMDSILGAIGTVALFVAALGIINTMFMSILERTREIGILKAIGGSERDIQLIFFIEAGTIGLIGAVFGLVLGWIVTRVANLVANAYFIPLGEPPVDLFYFPPWLVAGAILFSLFLSLAAGLYPAVRAANIDPTTALRHD